MLTDSTFLLVYLRCYYCSHLAYLNPSGLKLKPLLSTGQYYLVKNVKNGSISRASSCCFPGKQCPSGSREETVIDIQNGHANKNLYQGTSHLWGSKKYSSPRKAIFPLIIRHTRIKEIGMEVSNPGLAVDPSPNALSGRVMKLAPTRPCKVSPFTEMSWKWWHGA